MELPRGARRCEKADSIGGEWGFLRRSFVREWERFAKKVGAGVRLPLRGSLSSALGAPLLQGAAPLACKSAATKRHSLPDGNVNEIRIPLPPPKPSPRAEGAPKERIGHSRYEREWGKSSQVRR